MEAISETKELSGLEKIACGVVGTVFGLAPTELQIKFCDALTNNGVEASGLMSTSSRTLNKLASLYVVGSLAAKIFGVDIDLTPGDIATSWPGVALLAHTVVREALYGMSLALNGPCYFKYGVPFGEPIVSAIYSKIFSSDK